jgi:hypothetical protein
MVQSMGVLPQMRLSREVLMGKKCAIDSGDRSIDRFNMKEEKNESST